MSKTKNQLSIELNALSGKIVNLGEFYQRFREESDALKPKGIRLALRTISDFFLERAFAEQAPKAVDSGSERFLYTAIGEFSQAFNEAGSKAGKLFYDAKYFAGQPPAWKAGRQAVLNALTKCTDYGEQVGKGNLKKLLQP